MAPTLNLINNIMKKIILIFIIIFSNTLNSQKIYSTKYSSQSEFKVFKVNYESHGGLP